MKRAITTLALLVVAALAGAQSPNPNDYQPVLIPVFFHGPGAFGSTWTTDVNLINTGAVPILLPSSVFEENESGCDSICGCAPHNELPEFEAQKVCIEHTHPAGLLLHVSKGTRREDLQILTRIRDLSRQADSAGTEIPVVWPSDFRDNERLILASVPVDNRFRTGLRIYDLHAYRPTAFVRIFDRAQLAAGSQTPLVEASIDFEESDPQERSAAFPNRPRWLISIGDLVARFPALATVASVVIEVEVGHSIADPPQPNDVFWALVSVTNNATQQVTIVSPD